MLPLIAAPLAIKSALQTISMVSPTVSVDPLAVPAYLLISAATQTTSGNGTCQSFQIDSDCRTIKDSVDKSVDDDYSAPRPSRVAVRYDYDEYVGNFGKLDSCELASPEL